MNQNEMPENDERLEDNGTRKTENESRDVNFMTPSQANQKDDARYSPARMKHRVGSPDMSESPIRDD
ncbi:MAG: hypothetical protein C0507_07460 [Cyanobacteria bacterium PR.3.49]|nr:hypothetical protein [Cyanobacteria bacterium PR.3.49]